MSVIGIDLGNLASKIGCARKGGIDVLLNEASSRATPTLISYGLRARAVGETALTMQLSNFKNTVGSIKRLVGRTFQDEEVQSIESQFVTAALVDCGGEVGVSVNYAGEKQNFSATQLLATYLAKLRDIASHETQTTVTDVVISVPGWFTDVQRRAIISAAEIANLNCLRLINDSTAVSLLWGIPKTDLPEVGQKPKHVAFVDIGHSDYSVSIGAFNKGSLHVKATAYDRHFGGRNFDKALSDHFAHEFKDKYKIDVQSNAKALLRLLQSCEKLKKVLSANAVAKLSVENIMNDVDATSEMSRENFEALISPLLERIEVPLQSALAEAGLSVEDIDHIEVVGGSTRIPCIKDAISKFFGGRPLSFTLNQDEAIARGSTFACALLSPLLRVRPFDVKEMNSYPIKLSWEPSSEEQEDSHEAVLFPRGASTSISKSVTFHRSSDFDIQAQYVENSGIPKGINPWLGKVSIKGVKSAAEGGPSIIKAKVKLNIHGILTFVSAESLHEVIKEEVVLPTVEPMETDASATEASADAKPTEAAEPAEPETRKIRKLVKNADLNIHGVPALDKSILDSWKEREAQMHTSDKLVLETEERKNALEEYIYDQRSKTDKGGKLYAYITAEEKDVFHAKLGEAESWLYTEEGEEAAKSTYVSKLADLQKLGNPVNKRYSSNEDRPKASSALRDAINKYMTCANGGDEKYSHISEADNQSVVEKAVLAQQWLDDLTARQAERAKNSDPILTVEAINKKCEELTQFAAPIYMKAKPKPKVQPTPEKSEKADAPAEEAESAPAQDDKSAPPPGEMDVD